MLRDNVQQVDEETPLIPAEVEHPAEDTKLLSWRQTVKVIFSETNFCHIMPGLILGISTAACNSCSIIFLNKFIADMAKYQNTDEVHLEFLAGYFGLLLAGVGTNLLKQLINDALAAKIAYGLNNQITYQALNLLVSDHERIYLKSNPLSLLIGVSNASKGFFAFIDLISNIMQVAGVTIGAAFFSKWQIMSSFLAAFLLYPAYTYLASGPIVNKKNEIFRYQQQQFSRIQETFAAHKTVTIFNATAKEYALAEKIQRQQKKLQNSCDKVEKLCESFRRLIELFCQAILFFTCAYFIASKESESFVLSDLFTLQIFYTLFIGPWNSIADQIIAINNTKPLITEVHRIIHCTQTEAQQEPNRLTQHMLSDNRAKSIEFINVSFSYPGGNNFIEHLSFKLEAGETLAIIGNSGIGKSTILNLILGLYPNYTGQILIDNINLKAIEKASLRNIIGYIEQHTVIFKRNTLLFNAAYGNFDVHPQIIRERLADVHLQNITPEEPTVTTPMPSLSIGQSQRIGLCRALVGERKSIYLFDEPTASLDAQVERDILLKAGTLTQGKTRIFVSHKILPFLKAHKILFLYQQAQEYGPLTTRVAFDTPEQLLSSNKAFQELFALQSSLETYDEATWGRQRPEAAPESESRNFCTIM